MREWIAATRVLLAVEPRILIIQLFKEARPLDLRDGIVGHAEAGNPGTSN